MPSARLTGNSDKLRPPWTCANEPYCIVIGKRWNDGMLDNRVWATRLYSISLRGVTQPDYVTVGLLRLPLNSSPRVGRHMFEQSNLHNHKKNYLNKINITHFRLHYVNVNNNFGTYSK